MNPIIFLENVSWIVSSRRKIGLKIRKDLGGSLKRMRSFPAGHFMFGRSRHAVYALQTEHSTTIRTIGFFLFEQVTVLWNEVLVTLYPLFHSFFRQVLNPNMCAFQIVECDTRFSSVVFQLPRYCTSHRLKHFEFWALFVSGSWIVTFLLQFAHSCSQPGLYFLRLLISV